LAKGRARPSAGSGFYVADLFVGADGLTEGFRQAGFTPAVAVEFDRWAVTKSDCTSRSLH
jgi:hypothetical protein